MRSDSQAAGTGASARQRELGSGSRAASTLARGTAAEICF